jgi:hypothetical protein
MDELVTSDVGFIFRPTTLSSGKPQRTSQTNAAGWTPEQQAATQSWRGDRSIVPATIAGLERCGASPLQSSIRQRGALIVPKVPRCGHGEFVYAVKDSFRRLFHCHGRIAA